MQNLVLFFSVWPVISVFFATLLTRTEEGIDLFFLRSLEVSVAVLIVCYVLHITGIVHSAPEALFGAVVWGAAATLGECVRRIDRKKAATSSQSS